MGGRERYGIYRAGVGGSNAARQVRPAAKRANLAVAALAALALAGCATVRGSQEAPSAFRPSAPLVSYDVALDNYRSPLASARAGKTRAEYRDHVLELYLADIENKYRRFKEQLISTDRGSALAGDLLLLGLSGATALAGTSAADELATVTAVAAGARASVDKRLFFDRTMPAVIATMDARRAAIKTEIEIRRHLPDAQYSLGAGINDLIRLTDAGNINNGIDKITADAANQKNAAEARLNTVVEGCSEADSGTAAMNADFMALLRVDAARQPARLDEAAKLLDVTTAPGQAVTLADVRDAFDRKFCGDIGKRTFIDQLTRNIATREGS